MASLIRRISSRSRTSRTGDADDDNLAESVANSVQELHGQLQRAMRSDRADDWQDQQPLAYLQSRRRQLADGLLLLANDALALLNESDRHGVGGAVRSRLV